jgi:hypothetical protein
MFVQPPRVAQGALHRALAPEAQDHERQPHQGAARRARREYAQRRRWDGTALRWDSEQQGACRSEVEERTTTETAECSVGQGQRSRREAAQGSEGRQRGRGGHAAGKTQSSAERRSRPRQKPWFKPLWLGARCCTPASLPGPPRWLCQPFMSIRRAVGASLEVAWVARRCIAERATGPGAPRHDAAASAASHRQ